LYIAIKAATVIILHKSVSLYCVFVFILCLYGNIGDWCSRAGWGQIVLVANRNSGMLRLIASRHDDDDDDDTFYVLSLSIVNNNMPVTLYLSSSAKHTPFTPQHSLCLYGC